MHFGQCEVVANLIIIYLPLLILYKILSMIKNIANGIEHSNKHPIIIAAKPPITNKITIIALSV